ncbi:MAG: hypothetical protein P9L94_17390 [Candidatus Hinthialibacter antarcticus]|nr:hypothetical protein [Candidatus Hinthialibacter antarcticus]
MTDVQAVRDILKRVRQAHWRYCSVTLWNDFVRWFFYCGIVAALATFVMAFLPDSLSRLAVAGGIMACSVPAALVRFMMRSRSLTSTAVLADSRLRLKEKVSSALEFGREDELDQELRQWKSAAVMDAWRAVSNINLAAAFPWKNPREAGWLWVPLLALLLSVFVLPEFALLSGRGEAEAQTVEAKRIEKELTAYLQRQTVKRQVEEKKLTEVAKLSDELQELATELSKGQIDKRQAMSKLSSREQDWEKRKEELMKRMPEINPGADPTMKKLTGGLLKQLQNAEFEEAAQSLQTLQKQIKMGNLSPEDLERLAKEMEQMSAMMDMNMPLSKMLQGAAESLSSGNLQLSKNALQLAEGEMMDLQEMLEQIAMMEEALKDLKNAKLAFSGKPGECKKCGALFNKDGECSSCNGNGKGKGSKLGQFAKTGPWKPGESRNQGVGMGGPGIGRGGKAPFEDTDFTMTADQLRAKLQRGPVAGILPVDGQSVLTDSTVTVEETLFEYRQAAEDALNKEQIPVAYRHHVRAYFESLNPSASRDAAQGE